MYGVSKSSELDAISDEFSVELVRTKEDLQEAYRIRYQVYCLERGFEPAGEGVEIEKDDYDARTRHVLVRSSRNGQALGTVRLILPDHSALERSFPMQNVCPPEVLNGLPIAEMAEVSRFAVSKARRGQIGARGGLLRLSLVQGLVKLSHEIGVNYWCALMEPTLLRLLSATAIHFRSIGPLVEHHGLRQPAYNSLDEILQRMHAEQPPLWNFITEGGRLWPACDRRESSGYVLEYA